MTEEIREEYDLETLWTVGVNYDSKSQSWLRPDILMNPDDY